MAHATIPARSDSAPLPRSIRRVLARLDRRLRMAGAIRGLGTVALVLALSAAIGMAADFAWMLPQIIRWAIWGAWVGSCGLGLVGLVLRPLVKGPGALDLAAVAERGRPDLGERLTGAVDLLGTPHGSPAMIAALADDAAARAATIDPARAVALGPSARRLALGVAALALVAAPGAVWPGPYGALARRFLAPWVDIERVGRFVVTVAPGDQVVALGADLAVSARVRPRFGSLAALDDAWLEWTDASGSGHRVAMASGSSDSSPSRAFAVTLPGLAGSITYRVVSGQAVSRGYRIRAIEPPAVAMLSARVEPPAYTRLPASTARDPGRIEAWEGSRVTLDIATRAPVRSIEVEWPGPLMSPEPLSPSPLVGEGRGGGTSGQPRNQPIASASLSPHPNPPPQGGRGTNSETLRVKAVLRSDDRGGAATLVAEASGPYSLALRDEFGLANRPEPPRRLIVRADAPPVVAVQGSDASREARPDDILNVALAARDDVAVASVELHYEIRRGQGASADADAKPETGHVAAPLEGLGTRTARGQATLGLGALKLGAGDAVSYRVRVADNRPAPRGPNVVWSEPRGLAIVANAEPLEARQGRADREALQAKLDAIKKAAAENRKEAEQLRYAADASQRGNGAWDKERQDALDRREAEARGVADRLQLLARDLADDPRFRPLARPARQVAEVEAESGRAMLDQARREADPARRLADLRQADGRLAAVSTRLDELQRQFDAMGRREADLGKLRELAAREETIAARAAADGPADRARLDRLQAEQEAARADLDALLKKSPELRGDVLAAQAVEADDLARKARELAARQRDEARKSGDLSKRSEALKAVAEAQRGLEEDVRRLALDVDEPLTRNGRSRVNPDDVRQAADPIERGEVDAARRRLEGAEAELRRLARDLEDVPDDPRAQALRLARRQEALNEQVRQALREADRGKDPTPDEKAALAAGLKPLAGRQEAINRLAGEIKVPDNSPRSHEVRDAAEAAKRETAEAARTLVESKPRREIEDHQNRARDALNRLARAVPDPYQRQEPARKRLSELRREANDVARDLERALRETAPRPGKSTDPAKVADDLANRLAPIADRQARVAEELAKLEVEPRAEPQRDRAARRALALADALKAARDKPAPTPARHEARDRLPAAEADDLAALDRLEQKLNGRVPADDLAAELADDQRALEGGMAKPADDQRRIATALRNLDVPDAKQTQAEAVRRAEQSAQALADPKSDPGEAVREAARAASALADQLADRPPNTKAEGSKAPPSPLVGEKPADPELGIGPPQAARAQGLARRERQIRERLQAILGEGAEPQAALRRESIDLGRAVAELRDRARPLSDRAQGPAGEAARLLGDEAPRVMGQGAEHLAQAQPAAARDDQRRAAEVVERGAQQAEDLAAALRAEAAAPAQASAPAQAVPRPGPLAEAREAMRRAGRELDQARDPAQGQAAAQTAAAQAMRDAARGLRDAATPGKGSEPGSKGDPSQSAQSGPNPGDPEGPTDDPDHAMADAGTADLAELKDAIRRKTGRAWGELPGHLRTEILQMSQGRYRDDYARLIQLYFREIAAGADRIAPGPRP